MVYLYVSLDKNSRCSSSGSKMCQNFPVDNFATFAGVSLDWFNLGALILTRLRRAQDLAR